VLTQPFRAINLKLINVDKSLILQTKFLTNHEFGKKDDLMDQLLDESLIRPIVIQRIFITLLSFCIIKLKKNIAKEVDVDLLFQAIR